MEGHKSKVRKQKGCWKKSSAKGGLLDVRFGCTKQMVGFYFAAAGAFASLVGVAFPEICRYASGVAFCCTWFSVWLAHNNSTTEQ
jgi:hypothetical protein